MKKILVCGATGFIGRNLIERLAPRPGTRLFAVRHERIPSPALAGIGGVRWISADLRDPRQAARAVAGADVVLQAAAATSGSKDIVERPHHHVTDNAVMNSHLFRACHDLGVGRLIFLSCSVMYPGGGKPAAERDFTGDITPRYFGVGWTKVYLERMCEFYARLGRTKYTVIRHSNVYGPHDKFDFEKSHVFGATVAKVMTADREVVVWGNGRERRDLLHVSDLVDFVELALRPRPGPFDLVNVGSGRAVSVRELVKKIVAASGRPLAIRYDLTKPAIPFSVSLDCERAKRRYGWTPKIDLEEGIRLSLAHFRRVRRVSRGPGETR